MTSNNSTVKLADVAEVIMGQSPSGETYNKIGKGIPLLNGPTEFGLSHPTPTLWTTVPTRFCQEGDILFCVRGSTTGRMNWADRKYCIGRGIAAIRAKTGATNTYFIYYTLIHNLSRLLSRCSGSVFPNLSRQDLGNFEIEWFDEYTRVAIAHILGTLDDKIELNQQMNRKLEAIAQAIFKSWFVDFAPVRAKMEGRQPVGMDDATAALFPDSFEDSQLCEIPTGWKIVRLPEVAAVIDCLHSKKPSHIEQGNLLLQVENIADAGKLDLSKQYLISDENYKLWTSRVEVQEGDCVITNVGRVGAVAQIPQNVRAAIGRNMTAIRYMPGCLTPTYLVEYLLSPAMRAEIGLNTDSGTILDSLNVRGIEQLRLIIPPTPIMNAFEHKARPLRRRIELNIEESNSLAAIRDTLLPKLMSGKIRLKEAEKILEDAA